MKNYRRIFHYYRLVKDRRSALDDAFSFDVGCYPNCRCCRYFHSVEIGPLVDGFVEFDLGAMLTVYLVDQYQLICLYVADVDRDDDVDADVPVDVDVADDASDDVDVLTDDLDVDAVDDPVDDDAVEVDDVEDVDVEAIDDVDGGCTQNHY